MYDLADALSAPLPENECGSRQKVVCEVHKPKLHNGTLAGLERLPTLDSHDLRCLPQYAAVNHGLVSAANRGGVVENDYTGFELSIRNNIYK